jgi:adenosine deaminase
VNEICAHVRAAQKAGLGVTLHVAEVRTLAPAVSGYENSSRLLTSIQTKDNPIAETIKFLSTRPNRLGHATFLNAEARSIVHCERIAVEICLSSNLLCKTVRTLDDHHIQWYLNDNHPIAICVSSTLLWL